MNEWLLLVLLSLSTYRLTRLIVEDTFPPILWIRDRLVGEWRKATEEEAKRKNDTTKAENVTYAKDGETGVLLIQHKRRSWSPAWLAELLSCPWCASGWLAGGLVGSVAVISSVPLPGLFWLASWALGALLASRDWT